MARSNKVILDTFERAGQVLSVTSAPVGQKGTLKYTVAFSTGEEFETFKLELAQAAQALLGQPCTVQVEHSKNGNFDNYDLAGVVAGAAIGAVGGGQTIPAAGGSIPSATPIAQAAPIPVVDNRAKEAEGKTRHGQYQTATEFVIALINAGALEVPVTEDGLDRRALADEIVKWADAGTFYTQFGQSITSRGGAQEAAVPPAQPTEVEETAEVEVGAPVAAPAEEPTITKTPWS